MVPSLEGQRGGSPDLPTSGTERILRKPSFSLITLCSFSLLILIASAAFAHPGKTDYQDGHKCIKNCEDWDMNYHEYHLHDKDRNAIRMDGRKKLLREPSKKAEPEPSKREVVIVPILPTVEPQTEVTRNRIPRVIVDQSYSMPVEEGLMLTLYDFLLLGIAGLLLLAILVLRRKRERET